MKYFAILYFMGDYICVENNSSKSKNICKLKSRTLKTQDCKTLACKIIGSNIQYNNKEKIIVY